MVDAVKIARGRQAELAAENRRLSDFIGMAELLVKDGRLDTPVTGDAGAEAAEDTDDEADELVLAKSADDRLLAQRLKAGEKATTLRGSVARETATTRNTAHRDTAHRDTATRDTATQGTAVREAATSEPKPTTPRSKALFLRAHP